MVNTPQDQKMSQSRSITTIGLIGLVIVLFIIVLISSIGINESVNAKRTVAIEALNRMYLQLEKAPGVLERMLTFECDQSAGSIAVVRLEEAVQSLKNETGEYTITDMESIWGEIESAWTLVRSDCRMFVSDPSFRDLSTEMEGIRNRFTVEKGNYEVASENYNNYLKSFPANIFANGKKSL